MLFAHTNQPNEIFSFFLFLKKKIVYKSHIPQFEYTVIWHRSGLIFKGKKVVFYTSQMSKVSLTLVSHQFIIKMRCVFVCFSFWFRLFLCFSICKF